VVENLAAVGVGEDKIVVSLVARLLEVEVEPSRDATGQRHRAREFTKAPTAPGTVVHTDGLFSKGFSVRLNGVEPSRVLPPTRPSTLRVYQFRHSRVRVVDSRWLVLAGAWVGECGCRRCLKASAPAGSLRTGVRAVVRRCAVQEDRLVDLDLTKRQKEIFDFIRRYAAKTGYPPTVREIGKAVGLHSSSTVHAHLANLEKIGLLRRDPSKPRAIELLFDRAKKTILPDGSGLPLVGQVAAGEPVLAEENIEEYIEIPDVIGGEDGDYVLQVRGESMRDAGIFAGDYVVVRPAEEASDGEIVVALIGDEATVKRFYRESDHVRLQPENEAMEPIRTTEAAVLGRVVGVLRKV
jgi:repressor LexA